MNEHRIKLIRERLQQALDPRNLDILDESYLHAGHAGAKEGKGHFRVTVVAAAFADKSTLQRHRMIYAALGDMMDTDIHALSISAQTPDQ